MNDGGMPPGEMPTMYPQRTLKSAAEALVMARIIWFALFVSQGIYLFLGRVIVNGARDAQVAADAAAVAEPTGFMAGFQNPVGLAFLAAGAMALVMSFVLPKLINPGPMPVAPGMPAPVLDPARLPQRLRSRLFRFIIGAVINESVAVIGFVGGFVAMKNTEFGSAFVYASLAAMLARFPTVEMFADPMGARR